MNQFYNEKNQNNGSFKYQNFVGIDSCIRERETDQLYVKKFITKFGQQRRIMTCINGKIRQNFVDLHPNRENFLCIRREYELLLLDLCFTTISLCENRDTAGLHLGRKYLHLEEFNGIIILLFETQTQTLENYSLFVKYRNKLIQKFPQYLVCNSSLIKRYIEIQYASRQPRIDESKMLKVSEQFGYFNIDENLKLFRFYFSGGNCKNIVECLNHYLMAQFCLNQNLLIQFNTYSTQKLKNVIQNPKKIFQRVMKKSQFKSFLKKSQRENQAEIQSLTLKFPDFLSLYDFCCFIFNQRTNYVAMAEDANQNYPLTKYFCYSSHNTYLSGNQITSKSKKCRYTQDFQMGVKCVEIDIHKDGEVTHAFLGLSLSNSLDFQEVIKEIYVYRQDLIRNGLTHYPIILSLQNHVPTLKRQTLLSVLAKYFDTNCYYMDENDAQFPTLAQLKGKIVVKTNTKIVQTNVFKLIKQKLTDDISISSESSDSDDQSKSEQKYSLSLRINDFKNYHQQNNMYMKKAKSRRANFLRKIRKGDAKKSTHEPMVTVTGIFKSKNGIQNKNPNSFVCTSLTSKKALRKDPLKVLRYTKNSWLRVYPKNSAIRSSNYNPANFLRLGAQMIALNTQTKDDYALMMHCYFSAGRNQSAPLIGYILKPQYLVSQQLELPQNNLTYLRISILMSFGHKIKFRFIGTEQDMERNKNSGDGFSVKNPNQSFIIFDIGEKAKECIAVRFMRQGYRVIIGRNKRTFKDMGIRVLIFIERKNYFIK